MFVCGNNNHGQCGVLLNTNKSAKAATPKPKSKSKQAMINENDNGNVRIYIARKIEFELPMQYAIKLIENQAVSFIRLLFENGNNPKKYQYYQNISSKEDLRL